ncbi:MAG: TIGR03790 family protein [Bacteroidetes bacterium]|nr:TIGR03790 family protein [Bacteroidota bacterium]
MLLFYMVSKAVALEPKELLVVANSRMSGSTEAAQYYMKKREIPHSHLLSLPLSLNETISREAFDEELRKPVREKIKHLNRKVRLSGIVLLHGVPLKVDAPRPSWEDLDRIKKIREEIGRLQLQETTSESENKLITSQKQLLNNLLGKNKRAAVDSELSLVKIDNLLLEGWIKNPYFLGHKGTDNLYKKSQVLLVARLDGPDLDTVYRLIDDSLYTEKYGLNGVAYFDARWPYNETDSLSGYQLYDTSLHRAGEVTKRRMKTVIDDKEKLFGVHSCPSAALYSGWYSLGKYIDSFEWARGAIGYHIASAEADSLRGSKKNLWCLKMLEKGIAATIGPVHEPYVQGFPLPEIFFTYLTEGYLSLGETFLISLPYLSWQTILIGDPLYKPFSPME